MNEAKNVYIDGQIRKPGMSGKSVYMGWALVRVYEADPRVTHWSSRVPDAAPYWYLRMQTIHTDLRVTDRLIFTHGKAKGISQYRRACQAVLAILNMDPGIERYVKPEELLGRTVWAQLFYYVHASKTYKQRRVAMYWPYMPLPGPPKDTFPELKGLESWRKPDGK